MVLWWFFDSTLGSTGPLYTPYIPLLKGLLWSISKEEWVTLVWTWIRSCGLCLALKKKGSRVYREGVGVIFHLFSTWFWLIYLDSSQMFMVKDIGHFDVYGRWVIFMFFFFLYFFLFFSLKTTVFLYQSTQGISESDFSMKLPHLWYWRNEFLLIFKCVS